MYTMKIPFLRKPNLVVLVIYVGFKGLVYGLPGKLRAGPWVKRLITTLSHLGMILREAAWDFSIEFDYTCFSTCHTVRWSRLNTFNTCVNLIAWKSQFQNCWCLFSHPVTFLATITSRPRKSWKTRIPFAALQKSHARYKQQSTHKNCGAPRNAPNSF